MKNKITAKSIKKNYKRAFYDLLAEDSPSNLINTQSPLFKKVYFWFIKHELSIQNITDENLQIFKSFCDKTQLNINQVKMPVKLQNSSEFKAVLGDKTLLQYAIESNNEKLFDYLITDMRININNYNYEGVSPLEVAVRASNKNFADTLLEHGAITSFSSNIFNYRPYSEPLLNILAKKPSPMQNDDLFLAYKLINKGADLNVFGEGGLTAFQQAIVAGNDEMAKLLIDFAISSGEESNMINAMTNNTKLKKRTNALWLAMHNSKTDQQKKIIWMLIDNKADLLQIINSQNFLHILDGLRNFSYEELESLIDKFIQAGVDINLQDTKGMTPLHIAAQFQKFNLVKILIAKGADITLSNKKNELATDLLFKPGKLPSPTEVLLDTQASVINRLSGAQFDASRDEHVVKFVIKYLMLILFTHKSKDHLKFFYLFYDKISTDEFYINQYNDELKKDPEDSFMKFLEEKRKNIFAALPLDYTHAELIERLATLYIKEINQTVVFHSYESQVQNNFETLFEIAIELENINLVKQLFDNVPPTITLNVEKLNTIITSILNLSHKLRDELEPLLQKITIDKTSLKYKQVLSLAQSMSQLLSSSPARQTSFSAKLASNLFNSEKSAANIRNFLDEPRIKAKLSLAVQSDEKIEQEREVLNNPSLI